MAGPELTNTGRRALRSASEEPIVDAVTRLRRYFPEGRFLGNNNRYGRDAARRLSLDARQTPPRPVNTKHLCELLAGSVPVHCVDGWSLLSRAVSSHLSGDPHTARHLAYYAELRATVALLASRGIAIFNGPHYALDRSGAVMRITISGNQGTHNAAWLCLAGWARSRGSASPVAEIITPEGTPIDEWLRHFAGGADPWRPIAEEWIRTLGVDVRKLSEDRNARNAASYRPTSLFPRPQLGLAEAVDFVRAIWDALQPTTRAFDQLDRQFLRSSMRRSAEISGVAASQQDFDRAVARAVAGASVSAARHPVIARYLSDRGGVSPLIALARTIESETMASHHLHVMARATVLLRLATGASHRLYSQAGVAPDEFEFWWSAIASERGLVQGLQDVLDLDVVWADVQESIDELLDWLEEQPTASYPDLRTRRGQATRNVGALELVGLHGLLA